MKYDLSFRNPFWYLVDSLSPEILVLSHCHNNILEPNLGKQDDSTKYDFNLPF